MKKYSILAALLFALAFVALLFFNSRQYTSERKQDFYNGMMTFCLFAPKNPENENSPQRMYNQLECLHMVNQAIANRYFEQTESLPPLPITPEP